MFDYCKKHIYFIEISCPADSNVALKEVRKVTKYCDLATDYHQMYGMKVTIEPVVLDWYCFICLFQSYSNDPKYFITTVCYTAESGTYWNSSHRKNIHF